MKIKKKDSESKHKCRNLSEEQENKKREYKKNTYNMSEEKKQN